MKGEDIGTAAYPSRADPLFESSMQLRYDVDATVCNVNVARTPHKTRTSQRRNSPRANEDVLIKREHHANFRCATFAKPLSILNPLYVLIDLASLLLWLRQTSAFIHRFVLYRTCVTYSIVTFKTLASKCLIQFTEQHAVWRTVLNQLSRIVSEYR